MLVELGGDGTAYGVAQLILGSPELLQRVAGSSVQADNPQAGLCKLRRHDRAATTETDHHHIGPSWSRHRPLPPAAGTARRALAARPVEAPGPALADGTLQVCQRHDGFLG